MTEELPSVYRGATRARPVGWTVMRAPAAALMAMIYASGCGGAVVPATQRPPDPVATPIAQETAPSDPLDQAVIAFEGGHSRKQIKTALDKALTMYGLERTAENYSRAGSALVGLRQSAASDGCGHCSEMEILAAMISAGKLGNMTFPDAAAWAVTAIQALE